MDFCPCLSHQINQVTKKEVSVAWSLFSKSLTFLHQGRGVHCSRADVGIAWGRQERRHWKYSRFFERSKHFQGNWSPLGSSVWGPRTVFTVVGQNKEIWNSPARISRGFWVSHENWKTTSLCSPQFNTFGGKLNFPLLEIFFLLCSSSSPQVTWNFFPILFFYPVGLEFGFYIWGIDYLDKIFLFSALFQSCLLCPHLQGASSATCQSLPWAVFTASSTYFFHLYNLLYSFCITACDQALISWARGMVFIRKFCFPRLYILVFSIPLFFSLLSSFGHSLSCYILHDALVFSLISWSYFFPRMALLLGWSYLFSFLLVCNASSCSSPQVSESERIYPD